MEEERSFMEKQGEKLERVTEGSEQKEVEEYLRMKVAGNKNNIVAIRPAILNETLVQRGISPIKQFSTAVGEHKLEATETAATTTTTVSDTSEEEINEGSIEDYDRINKLENDNKDLNERLKDYEDRVLKLEEENLELKRSYEHLMASFDDHEMKQLKLENLRMKNRKLKIELAKLEKNGEKF